MAFDIDYTALFSLRYGLLVSGGTVLLLGTTLLVCCNWKDVLAYFSGQSVRLSEAFPVFSKSNAAKYLPGNIGHYVSRQIFGASLGIKQGHLVIASVLEIFNMVFTALLLSAPFLWDIYRIQNPDIFPVIIFLLCCIAVLITVYTVFRKTKYFSGFIALVKDKKYWLLLLKIILRSLVWMIVLGGIFVFIMGTKVTVNFTSAAIIMGANAAAWLIGFVTPGAPGGIGVRESVLLLMLSPYFSAEIILTSAVIHRLIMVLGDISAFLLGLLVKKAAAPLPLNPE
jgi:hypothetical protein